MSHNIGQTLADTAAAYPDRTGLISRNGMDYRSWTFKEMNHTADSFAHEFAELGVKKGDRVMLMVKPSLEFVTLVFALFKMGAVIVLIDPGMGYRNLMQCIGRVKPNVFIGVFKAFLFKTLFPHSFKTIRLSVCISSSYGFFRPVLSAETVAQSTFWGTVYPAAEVRGDDTAAILFTTGSTGPPKGVCYTHAVFAAQLELIRDYYNIGPDDIDQPAFPLFALFSAALGACTVIPEMDAAKPARVDPARFISTISRFKVTYSFGSPAIWNVVSRYCQAHKIRLDSVKKILMAGAPVPGDLLARTEAVLPPDAEIHTPYGATESLPVTSITAAEILSDTWEKTRQGRGVCVGRPLPSLTVRIIKISDLPIQTWNETLLVPDFEPGEIVVKGSVVTWEYDDNERENKLAKIEDGDEFWHRMGDLGYFDDRGRLWFCGRKAHRVIAATGVLYTVCCEALFNEHPAVFRSALVGIGSPPKQIPVIIVEPHDRKIKPEPLLDELRRIARQHEITAAIEHFLVHANFPVDIRHNAKIFREKLARWAVGQLTAVISRNREQG